MSSLRRRDPLDVLATVLLALEALVLVGVAAVYAAYAIGGEHVELAATLGIGAFALAMAGGIALVTRGFARGARWSRGAALTWQVLQAAAAVVMLGAVPAIAIALLVASAVVAAAAMRASARDAAAGAENTDSTDDTDSAEGEADAQG
ncbi:hypothetical protein [Demequina sp. NBRC 110054]|uniref:hypothetical protein n=1 Tax=Demequina sp. NBRC 110054 TaxID=1570343 RepID=UPI000A06931F|nr:hypothetical protein [Demequina sp. NBRC 110054]